MTAADLEALRMAKMCTFPKEFKKDLIKLGVEEQLADDMGFAFFSHRNRDNEYDFFGFLHGYCYGDAIWTEAILKYINSFMR